MKRDGLTKHLVDRLRADGSPLCLEAADALERRWSTEGLMVGTIPPGAAERFWAKVLKLDEANGCWLWQGRKHQDGYGLFWVTGRGDKKAHRVSCALHGREIPRGMVADHLCKNRGCVNPAHIAAVSVAVNVMNSDGPSARNARATHCKNCGNPYAGANLAILPFNRGRSATRACLTCKPTYWMWAVVPRERPPGAHCKAWRGPYTPPSKSND